MHKIPKDRIKIPLVSRNVWASTGGVVFLIIGLPFFLGEGVMLLEQILKQTPSTYSTLLFLRLGLCLHKSPRRSACK